MKKAIKGLKNLQVMVAAVFLFIFLMTVVLQMATRFMGIAATWTEDVSMYSFIWAVFMGGAAMVDDKRHFAFTSFYDKLKNEKAKSVLQIVIDIAVMQAYGFSTKMSEADCVAALMKMYQELVEKMKL